MFKFLRELQNGSYLLQEHEVSISKSGRAVLSEHPVRQFNQEPFLTGTYVSSKKFVESRVAELVFCGLFSKVERIED